MIFDKCRSVRYRVHKRAGLWHVSNSDGWFIGSFSSYEDAVSACRIFTDAQKVVNQWRS